MEQHTEINPTPNYWDGESAFFMQDAHGRVEILRESGSPTEIAERKWAEAKEARSAK